MKWLCHGLPNIGHETLHLKNYTIIMFDQPLRSEGSNTHKYLLLGYSPTQEDVLVCLISSSRTQDSVWSLGDERAKGDK